jgi:hypothetical protein
MIRRNCAIVACQIAEIIPKDETKLHDDFLNLIMNYAYVAPEMLFEPGAWIKLENLMYKYIPTIDSEWKQKAVEIFVGASINESEEERKEES